MSPYPVLSQEMSELDGGTIKSTAELPKSKEIQGRGQWSKGIEFLLSCISMSVGLGNVWRFPHTAYTNGGGAFLIPYLLLLFIIGRPMYYMELVLGQFSGRGPIKVWKCVPAFKGIGFAQFVSQIYLIIFYNYLMATTLYYLYISCYDPLPWSKCDSDWIPNVNCSNVSDINWSEKFYEQHVLKKSTGLEDMNLINWHLVLCLVISWILVFLSIIKGVSSMGKVAYFTAIFPYSVLIALLGVALSTDGAIDGIKYFFTPEWSKLLEPIVWYKAVEQSFFSLAVCFGTLVMFSSYNEFRNNVYRDAIIIAILDTFTSLLAGCVIFSILGHLSKSTGTPIQDVVKGGMGLAFVVYPEALTKIAIVPQLWSVLFFIMLFTLGIGSSVAQVETVLTSIKDQFSSLHQKKGILALVVCIVFCLLGLPLTTDAGLYVMTILDNYGVGTAVFFYGICQTVAIFWIYGLNNFCSDLQFMLNKRVGRFWKVTWVFATPVALIVIFIFGNISIIQDNEKQDGIPQWGTGLGWGLAAFAIIQIPLWFGISISQQKGGSLIQQFKDAFRPTKDWGPINPKIHQEWVEYKTKQKFGYTNPAFNSSNNVQTIRI